MTVQEIFNTKAVQEIETEILNLQYETEKGDYLGIPKDSLLRVYWELEEIFFIIISSWTKNTSCC